MVSIETGVDKSLIYQTMSLINLGAIVLTIIPIITLIEDQKREFKQRGISTLAPIVAAVKTNSNI